MSSPCSIDLSSLSISNGIFLVLNFVVDVVSVVSIVSVVVVFQLMYIL